MRDLPEANDADLRTIHKVAPDLDAAPGLYYAASLLHTTKEEETHLWEWAKGKSWDEVGVAALLRKNAPVLEAFTALDGEPGLAVPPERVKVPHAPSDPDPVFEDTIAWQNLASLRVLRALQLHRHGQTQAALTELLSTARLGYVIQGASNGSLLHYLAGGSIKAKAFNRLIDVAAGSKLPRETLLTLATEVAALDANERGFAETWAGEYRIHLTFEGPLSDSMQTDPLGFTNSALGFVEEPFVRTLATPLAALLPADYVYQPHRSEMLWADSYRSLQRGSGETYLAYSREVPDVNSSEILLRIIVGPDSVGLALWRYQSPFDARWEALKCHWNVRAAATSTILALLAYEQEHGSLPERLDELVPSELDHVPIDDFDGAPLRYSRERRLLWSVGTELRDEGGSDPGYTARSIKQPTFLIPG